MPLGELQLGVDVGATNTDAVLMDARHQMVAQAKAASTPTGLRGIAAAVKLLTERRPADGGRVTRAMLGASRLMADTLQRRRVDRVAVIRIGSPLTLAVPPLTMWPRALRRAASAGEVVVRGGAEYDGRPVAPLDVDAIAGFLHGVAERIDGVAITGVFSPVAPDDELAAAEIVWRELGGGMRVSLSHEVGSLGLLERENATVLNAALAGAAQRLADGLRAVLAARAIDAELFFAQNDGTVMALEHALRFPVLMIHSGAASSMRGAVHLSGVGDGVVIDAGGATMEVGALINGFPRTRAVPTTVEGVRMDFRTPDVVTLAIGGASVVTLDGYPPTIGPRHAGHRVAEHALVFGGTTPTLLDAAVAGGWTEAGTRALTAAQRRALTPVLPVVERLIADAVDRVRAGLLPPPLVVVGGAAMLVPRTVEHTVEVLRPRGGEVASAIGVATAPVGGQADRISANRPDRLRRALEDARAAAFAHAIHAGADPDAVEVVEVEEIPLSYLTDPAVRIRVKAVGPWA